jgi:hypothetical protein
MTIAYLVSDLAFLAKVLEAADGDTFENLEGRITIQKKIYLLQIGGVDLGYSFAWNTFGPYSPALAKDCRVLEQYLDQANEKAQLLTLRDEVRDRIERAVVVINAVPTSMPSALWLELVTSVHMLARINFPDVPVQDLMADQEVRVQAELERRKPYMKEFIAQAGAEIWSSLKTLLSDRGGQAATALR